MKGIITLNEDAKAVIEALQETGLTFQESLAELKEMRRQVLEENADPEELLNDIGLEPDYIFALL
jgi:uncharacterized protein YjiS (DUF1127 family)